MMLWLSTHQYLSPAGRVEEEQCGLSGPGREAHSTSPTGSPAGLRSAELLLIDILSLGGELFVLLNITLGGRNTFALEL